MGKEKIFFGYVSFFSSVTFLTILVVYVRWLFNLFNLFNIFMKRRDFYHALYIILHRHIYIPMFLPLRWYMCEWNGYQRYLYPSTSANLAFSRSPLTPYFPYFPYFCAKWWWAPCIMIIFCLYCLYCLYKWNMVVEILWNTQWDVPFARN